MRVTAHQVHRQYIDGTLPRRDRINSPCNLTWLEGSVRGQMMNLPLLVTSFIDRASELFGDVEIVSRRADRSIHRYTYKECRDRARRLAMVLHGLGLQPGDRVATLMWNHYAHVEAYFGIPLAGGVSQCSPDPKMHLFQSMLTRTMLSAFVTRPEPPAHRKASSILIARWRCTRSRCHFPMYWGCGNPM